MHVSLTLGANAAAVVWKILCHGSKISESVFFEFAADAMHVRLTSPNRTTHLCVKFPVRGENIFTSNYQFQPGPVEVADEWGECSELPGPNVAQFMCRPLILALKPCAGLPLMRSYVEYDSTRGVLTIRNQYAKGLTKNFHLTTAEASLERPMDERQLDCVVVCEAQQMNKILDVFPSHLTRLTMKPEQNTVTFKAESGENFEMPSMDSVVSAGCDTFSNYRLASDAPKFSKTFDPKGLRVFVDLASYLNQTFRLEAGPGTHPVSLELEASTNGVFVISMLIASYDELGMHAEKAGQVSHRTTPIHRDVTEGTNAHIPDGLQTVTKRPCSQLGNSRVAREQTTELVRNMAMTAPPLTLSQGVSQRTPAPQLRSATEIFFPPGGERHPSQECTQPLAEEVRPLGRDSMRSADSPLCHTQIESSTLAEKYGQGKFPLRMSVEQLHTGDKDRIQLSVDSLYDSEMFSLEDAPDMF